jgi:hypothetical protein
MYVWDVDTGGGDYFDPNHWQDAAHIDTTPPAGPPSATDVANIVGANVSSDRDISVQGMGRLNVDSSASLTVNALLTFDNSKSSEIGGTLNAKFGLVIASTTGSQGALGVDGTVVATGLAVEVGYAGTGSITVNGTFDASNNDVILGDQSNSYGQVVVTANGTFKAGTLTLGENGTGNLAVQGGHGSFSVANDAPVIVGDAGMGSISVLQGGQFDAVSSEVDIGNRTGSSGIVQVDGVGSTFTADKINLDNGGGVGSLLATNGGYVNAVATLGIFGSGTVPDCFIDSSSSVEVGGSKGAAAGHLVIDAGGSLGGHGLIDSTTLSSIGPIYSLIVDNAGNITASLGRLTIHGDCSGSGMWDIQRGSTLELGGSFSGTVTFSGTSATLVLDQPDPSRFTGTIAGLVPGDTIELPASAVPGIEFAQLVGSQLKIAFSNGAIWSYTLSGDYTNDTFQLTQNGTNYDLTLVQPHTQVSPPTIQNDYLGIIRTPLPLDQATTEANAINAGTDTETAYVNGLLAQVADTTIPAVAVEASMYNAVGTSVEVSALTTQFLPPQVANALKNGLDPQVYATEALGLVFAFGNENHPPSTAFADNFGPSNPSMPNTLAGDAAFASTVSNIIFASDANAHTPDAIAGFVANWKAFYSSNGIPAFPTPTATQVDLAARGAAWGDAMGVALENNLGPWGGLTTNFLEDAAQGTAVYSASLASQPTPAPFQGATTASAATASHAQLTGVAAPFDHVLM